MWLSECVSEGYQEIGASHVLVDLHEIGTVTKSEIDAAVFEVKTGMPTHLETTQMLVAEIVLGKQVQFGFLRYGAVDFGEISVKIESRLTEQLYAEIKTYLWCEIEIVSYRHAVGYIDREIQIEQCAFDIDIHWVIVIAENDLVLIKDGAQIQSGTHIERKGVAYPEIYGVACSDAVEI